MLSRTINRRLAAEEAKLGGSLDWLRHIARVSLPAFVKFVAFTPLSKHRKALPPGPYHVARLVAVRAEDCGSCVKIELHLAKQAGVPAEVLRAAYHGRPDELPEELADVYRFAEAVVGRGDDPGLRERIKVRYGEAGVVELAIAIATCRVFPTTKRALGYAVSCERVGVEVS